jgi:hypothetical protein
MKNPKNLKIEYILAAHRVNPPRLGLYFWTLVCPEVVNCMLTLQHCALNYLRVAFEKLGDLNSIYDALLRTSMYDKFYPVENLKKNYKHHIELGKYLKKLLRRCS